MTSTTTPPESMEESTDLADSALTLNPITSKNSEPEPTGLAVPPSQTFTIGIPGGDGGTQTFGIGEPTGGISFPPRV
ncbi:hypothetical protein MKZ38_005834 [Zalerion maritima]|uniref:Uncharacterized protein n=1 Tax=Zalerion maritima TaxID=339359 RepID=A0AAD5RX82_9PEZI|nr:hypothetical protein MKZ38_005834 [Zalerion maritima]